MAAINVTSVQVLNNPCSFLEPFQFDISYECLAPLEDDLEWKIIYVGCAEDDKYDQVLDSVLVGPVERGAYRFVFQADAPDASKLPLSEVLGVTVVLLTCSYNSQEFIRVGYYINNEYDTQELREEPPREPLLDRVVRNILATDPRVTKFPISWDNSQQRDVQDQPMSKAEAGYVFNAQHDADNRMASLMGGAPVTL